MSLTTQEETPKKFRRSATNDSSCRLCGSIEDKSHSKNLFKNNNHELLNLARSLSGEQLLRHENLPELICRPCERRIGNFKAFRLKIQESQTKFKQFSKRCVEISPSVVPPAKTVRRVSTSPTKTASARTRLNFTGDEVSLISKLLLKFNVSHVPYTFIQ
jgi:hypothetical protein